MMNRRRLLVQICSCCLLSVCLVLQLSFFAPKAYAAWGDTTVSIPLPDTYTGMRAGTNQTGIPYSSISFYGNGGSIAGTSVITSPTHVAAYSSRFGFNLNYAEYDDITFELGLAEPVVFRAGYDYVCRLYLFNANSASYAGGFPTTEAVVQVDFDGIMIKNVVVPRTTVTAVEFAFLASANDSADSIRLKITGPSLSYIQYCVGWLKVYESNPVTGALSDLDQRINNSTTQLQNSIENQTSATVGAIDQQTSAIGGFFQDLFAGIMSLIIPDAEYFSTFFSDFNFWMDEHFGALYYPISFFLDVVDGLVNLEVTSNPSITLPAVSVLGEELWEETVYTFDFSDGLDGLGLGYIYSMYLIVVDAIIAFALLNLAKRKLDELQTGK